jgi:hypothetical protein
MPPGLVPVRTDLGIGFVSDFGFGLVRGFALVKMGIVQIGFAPVGSDFVIDPERSLETDPETGPETGLDFGKCLAIRLELGLEARFRLNL